MKRGKKMRWYEYHQYSTSPSIKVPEKWYSDRQRLQSKKYMLSYQTFDDLQKGLQWANIPWPPTKMGNASTGHEEDIRRMEEEVRLADKYMRKYPWNDDDYIDQKSIYADAIFAKTYVLFLLGRQPEVLVAFRHFCEIKAKFTHNAKLDKSGYLIL
jgi:hypothetical protein